MLFQDRQIKIEPYSFIFMEAPEINLGELEEQKKAIFKDRANYQKYVTWFKLTNCKNLKVHRRMLNKFTHK